MNQSRTSTQSDVWKFYFALFIGCATLATHFYLALHYFELNLGLSSGSAICNINSTFNCDTVAASKYSSIAGVPMALWGLTTQLILFIWTLIFGFGLSKDEALIGRFSFYLSLFVASTSIVMGTISLIYLKSFCVFCMIAYVLSFIHVVLIYSLQKPSLSSNLFQFLGEDLLKSITNFKWISISGLSIVALAFLFNGMFLDHFGGGRLKEMVNDAVLNWQSSPSVNFTHDGLSKGSSEATFTIVEFADFMCPHCKHAVPSLKVFVETHPQVRLIFKPFPLDGTCNAKPDMPKGDGLRCTLAKAVLCAEKLNQKGWALYEDVFNNQEELYNAGGSNDLLNSLLTKNALNIQANEACRNSEETHKDIIDQSNEGVIANIEGTPSIFVNGRYLSKGHMLPVLQKAFESINNTGSTN